MGSVEKRNYLQETELMWSFRYNFSTIQATYISTIHTEFEFVPLAGQQEEHALQLNTIKSLRRKGFSSVSFDESVRGLKIVPSWIFEEGSLSIVWTQIKVYC